jgi:hypothetical protein
MPRVTVPVWITLDAKDKEEAVEKIISQLKYMKLFHDSLIYLIDSAKIEVSK